MRHLVNAGLAVVCVGLTIGCSQNLHRLQVRHMIDAALKLRPEGPAHMLTTGYLPGFRVQDDGAYSVDNFQLGTIPGIGDSDPTAPLYDALAANGYLTITPLGPDGAGGLAYDEVAMGPRAGKWHAEGSTQVYEAGFRCYQMLGGVTECQVPPLLVPEPRHYRISDIQQNGNRARVLVTIPWKLTPLGLELKAWAAQHQERTYEAYWEGAVRHHDAEGMTPATVWFQRFPSGWQIVDENGMTEKQFDQMVANR